ncbi:Tfp pilus assembly protein FimT [Actinoplanes campanulatus]|uniref:Tfp pilus assembly protein FimT n=1 Tax=Actinoplanes campanulatus TaxID=113559 RepID=A0A7W5AED2_9ACTN|nr:hypothetical protein [Actinoplanes campanulatus]MBB3094470.1 Tfp pilus assembly protein FimT [Actinoplanes campanulatus]GGN21273.1 hypothetical protein GCM10010109_35330 [Actinoplanes campanulatus]GID35617.1 hypothetical protein Aca09nite_21230 [Actinoplanes campanulatus]
MMRDTRVVAWISIGVLVVMAGIGVLSHAGAKQGAAAQEKADQLVAELTAAGLRAPATDQIVQVLGDDGGAVCLDPGDALRRGILYGQLTNGAAGPGQRPVIAGNNVVQGQLIIMKVYCPGHLEEFQEIVDDLKLAEVDT